MDTFQSLQNRFIDWLLEMKRDRVFMTLLSIFLLSLSLLVIVTFVANLYEESNQHHPIRHLPSGHRATSYSPTPSDRNSRAFDRYFLSPSFSPSYRHRDQYGSSPSSPSEYHSSCFSSPRPLSESDKSPSPGPNFFHLSYEAPISFQSLLRVGYIDSAGNLTPLVRKPDSLKRIGEMGTEFGYRRTVRLGKSWLELCRGSLSLSPAAQNIERGRESDDVVRMVKRVTHVELEGVDEEDVVQSIEVDYH